MCIICLSEYQRDFYLDHASKCTQLEKLAFKEFLGDMPEKLITILALLQT